jgi:methionine-rich copper-binding protein CopC
LWAVALALVCAGAASAHAYLKVSEPGEDSTVGASPKEVRLVFTEPVETRFSIFKVYAVKAEPGWDQRRLNAAAGALMSDVLARRGDEADRADDGLATTARTTPEIAVRLKGELKPGSYVVMWRVLSIDTHTTQGFYVFTIAPR